jgi:hypothetical protein
MPKLLFVMLPFTVLPMLYQILNLSFINFNSSEEAGARRPVTGFQGTTLGPDQGSDDH